jgi:hypothetical protein
MTRELDGHGREADARTFLDELLGFVSAEMSEPPVVAAIRGPKDARDVRERVRDGHPQAPARLEHACSFAQRGGVVRDMLEDGDRDDCRERRARERESLGRATQPQRPVGDALVGSEPSGTR